MLVALAWCGCFGKQGYKKSTNKTLVPCFLVFVVPFDGSDEWVFRHYLF